MSIIALAGNPNSGKSSIFNQLTGLRQKVANFPGVTVEKKFGKLHLRGGVEATLIDLPGAYSLYPNSQDEQVVLNVLANPADENYPDAIVYIADVTNLEKHLLLLTQILDLGFPCLLALNMSDIAEKEGIKADVKRLSDFLKIPVIPVSGRKGTNIDVLKEGITVLLNEKIKGNGHFALYEPSGNEQEVLTELKQNFDIDNPYRALLLAHHFKKLPFLKTADKERIEQSVKKSGFQDIRLQIAETMRRFDKFTPVLRQAITKNSDKTTFSDKLDAVLTHRTFAPLIFVAIMFLVFQAIYAWAEYPMNWIESGFAWISGFVKNTLPAGWFADLLTDGVLAGLGGILVFVPQIAILFLLITILEEIGYMARAVFIFDKIMQQFGLNGRSVVALISGGACAIPAIMSTRTIGNWKERLITIMVTPFISCSARIPVYAVLIGFVVPSKKVAGIFNLQGLAFMGLYLLGIGAALISAVIFKKILRSEERSFLMLQLPPYRFPVWKNVWHAIYEKVSVFVWEAGKVILLISVVLWALASYGPAAEMELAEKTALETARQENLDEEAVQDLVAARKIEASYAGHIGKWIEPAIRPLGFDWKIGIALVTSFAAREVFVATMATLYSIGSSDDESTVHDRLSQARRPETGELVYTPATALSLLIFYVFAMQCMSTLAVVKRETGHWKWAFLQFAFMSGLAYLGSLLVYQIMA